MFAVRLRRVGAEFEERLDHGEVAVAGCLVQRGDPVTRRRTFPSTPRVTMSRTASRRPIPAAWMISLGRGTAPYEPGFSRFLERFSSERSHRRHFALCSACQG